MKEKIKNLIKVYENQIYNTKLDRINEENEYIKCIYSGHEDCLNQTIKDLKNILEVSK